MGEAYRMCFVTILNTTKVGNVLEIKGEMTIFVVS